MWQVDEKETSKQQRRLGSSQSCPSQVQLSYWTTSLFFAARLSIGSQDSDRSDSTKIPSDDGSFGDEAPRVTMNKCNTKVLSCRFLDSQEVNLSVAVFFPAATKIAKWWGHLFCIIVGFFDRHLSNSIATCWCIWRRQLRRKAPTYRAHLRRLPFCLHVLVALSKGWVVIQSNISPPKHESTFTSQKHAKTRV